MNRLLGLVWVALLANPQFGAAASSPSPVGTFHTSLQRLAAELTIPGMAYAIVGDGKILHTGQLNSDAATAPLTIDTPRRFASVTKALTAVTLMRAVDRGALSLDDSLSQWLPEFEGDAGVKVRHLAAHSSEGIPGTEYVYSTNRYAKLGKVLTQALKAASFEEVLRKEILAPVRMSWRDSPHLGAHAGFVSTVSDMALFVQALQENRLLSRQRFEEMTTPSVSPKGRPMPTGVGFFSQQLGDERVVWSFGQDDPDHSSALLLMLPQRNLALVLLANTDELSNPFRLLMGDLRYSPFATAFLDALAPELGKSIGERERLAQNTLVSIWREDSAAATKSFQRFVRLAASGPHDVVAHFIAAALMDSETEGYARAVDTDLFSAHPTNRWVLLTSGRLNTQLKRFEVADRRYEAILALPNQEPDGLAALFRAWSFAGRARIWKSTVPQRALLYVEQGLATGVTGGTRDDLVGIRKELVRP
jgi:CubicO group peptidase (beta-lactamase class C family)